MEIKDLKDACSILGLDYKEFVETAEVEKSVVADYRALYEQQKALNEKILSNISEVSKSFSGKLESFQNEVTKSLKDQIKELTKSFGSLKEEMNDMKNTPMRKSKSATKVNVIEKAFAQQNNGVQKIFNISNFGEKKELKKLLGDKALEELQKGVNNGVYERAAMQLDASGFVTPDLAQQIFQKDKILIQ